MLLEIGFSEICFPALVLFLFLTLLLLNRFSQLSLCNGVVPKQGFVFSTINVIVFFIPFYSNSKIVYVFLQNILLYPCLLFFNLNATSKSSVLISFEIHPQLRRHYTLNRMYCCIDISISIELYLG